MSKNSKILLVFMDKEVHVLDGSCLVAPLSEEVEGALDEMMKEITVGKRKGWCG